MDRPAPRPLDWGATAARTSGIQLGDVTSSSATMDNPKQVSTYFLFFFRWSIGYQQSSSKHFGLRRSPRRLDWPIFLSLLLWVFWSINYFSAIRFHFKNFEIIFSGIFKTLPYILLIIKDILIIFRLIFILIALGLLQNIVFFLKIDYLFVNN